MVSANPVSGDGGGGGGGVGTASAGCFAEQQPGMALPGMMGSLTATSAAAADSAAEDPSKKLRKPYTITKSRESWTEPEHDKFLEAIQLFDRDWKKIEAFVGSKTVIQGVPCPHKARSREHIKILTRSLEARATGDPFRQGTFYKIRSHAQKYFLKVQKNGTSEHVPPPRPKRKAAHPYPQKASKNAPLISQPATAFQGASCLLEPGYAPRTDSSSVLKNSSTTGPMSSWAHSSVHPRSAHMTKENTGPAGAVVANNCCSSTGSPPSTWPACETNDQGNRVPSLRAMPDFAQVYSFIGSVFDPSTSGHLQKLKEMDPIDVETVLLLMRNLSVNLTSPDFEDHRKLLASYEVGSEEVKSGTANYTLEADEIENGSFMVKVE